MIMSLPIYYSNVLEMVLKKTVKIKPFTETRPMSKIKEVFEEAHKGILMKRVVLTPDF